jgi:Ala-tRNA(Pro) deacylase
MVIRVYYFSINLFYARIIPLLKGKIMNKQEVYNYLNTHHIEYEITEHEAVYNMNELDAIDLPYPEFDAKNLFVRDDKKRNYYLITVKGDKRVDLKEFRKQNGLRALSFCSADDLFQILGLEPGSVTPLGLLNDHEHKVTLFLDSAFEDEIIGVHPNDNTATVWLKSKDLIGIIEEHGNIVKVVSL